MALLRRIWLQTWLPGICVIAIYCMSLDTSLGEIFAGVAIFLLGMDFLENGFKGFSGGLLEKNLKKYATGSNKDIEKHLRQKTLSATNATSLLNDIAFVNSMGKKLLKAVAKIYQLSFDRHNLAAVQGGRTKHPA